MPSILPGILSLVQHITTLAAKPQCYSPQCCPRCKRSGVWSHGHYERKADRQTGVLNPVLIPRFLCRHCQRTCSVLPECIPPRRWYPWWIQQAALLGLLSQQSLRQLSQCLGPSRSTMRRWWQRLQERFKFHYDALCSHLSALGRTSGFNNFWQYCLQHQSLDHAMLICHQAGVVIP